MKTIMKFLFPEKPNHPDVSGRLDIFAKYGPVLDYHIHDLCFCKECKIPVKFKLIRLVERRINEYGNKVEARKR